MYKLVDHLSIGLFLVNFERFVIKRLKWSWQLRIRNRSRNNRNRSRNNRNWSTRNNRDRPKIWETTYGGWKEASWISLACTFMRVSHCLWTQNVWNTSEEVSDCFKNTLRLCVIFQFRIVRNTFREIREKSTVTGRTTTKWSLESVKSCEKVINEPPTIHITFNTVRKACQERTYVMEFSDAQVGTSFSCSQESEFDRDEQL